MVMYFLMTNRNFGVSHRLRSKIHVELARLVPCFVYTIKVLKFFKLILLSGGYLSLPGGSMHIFGNFTLI